MAFTPLPGNIASVSIAMTGYAFDKHSFDQKSNNAKVGNFTTGGFSVVVPGMIEGTINCSGPYDEGNMTAFIVGDAISLILGYDMGVNVTVPTIVASCKITADVNDAQRVEVSFDTNGPFTLGPQ